MYIGSLKQVCVIDEMAVFSPYERVLLEEDDDEHYHLEHDYEGIMKKTLEKTNAIYNQIQYKGMSAPRRWLLQMLKWCNKKAFEYRKYYDILPADSANILQKIMALLAKCIEKLTNKLHNLLSNKENQINADALDKAYVPTIVTGSWPTAPDGHLLTKKEMEENNKRRERDRRKQMLRASLEDAVYWMQLEYKDQTGMSKQYDLAFDEVKRYYDAKNQSEKEKILDKLVDTLDTDDTGRCIINWQEVKTPEGERRVREWERKHQEKIDQMAKKWREDTAEELRKIKQSRKGN